MDNDDDDESEEEDKTSLLLLLLATMLVKTAVDDADELREEDKAFEDDERKEDDADIAIDVEEEEDEEREEVEDEREELEAATKAEEEEEELDEAEADEATLLMPLMLVLVLMLMVLEDEASEELAAITGPGPRVSVTDALLVDDELASPDDPEDVVLIATEDARVMPLEEAAAFELLTPRTALELLTLIAMLEGVSATDEEMGLPDVAKEIKEAMDDMLYWLRSQLPKATWQPVEQ